MCDVTVGNNAAFNPAGCVAKKGYDQASVLGSNECCRSDVRRRFTVRLGRIDHREIGNVMGLLDSAKEKAATALLNAEKNITVRTTEAERAKSSLNQIMQAADDKQVANRSAQEAEIKELQLQLKDSQSKLDADKLASDVAHKLTDLPLISGPTEPIRQSYAAVVAQAQADTDQLQAQLSAAKAARATPATPAGDESAAVDAAKDRVDRANSRLAMAQGRKQLAQKALDAVNGMQSGE